MDKQMRVIPTKEDSEYMNNPKVTKPINKEAIRKANPIMSKSVIARLKAQTGEDFTKPIDIYLPESERTKIRGLVDYSPFIKGQITEDERKKWVKRYIDKLLIESANHAAKQIVEWGEGYCEHRQGKAGIQNMPRHYCEDCWQSLKALIGEK